MGKTHKKPQTRKYTPIPHNRFHSDMVKESVEEARRRAKKEADHYKRHPRNYEDS